MTLRLRERVGNLLGDVERGVEIDRCAPRQLRERRPLDVLHRDVVDPVTRVRALADLVDDRDVRVIERRRGARFGEQAFGAQCRPSPRSIFSATLRRSRRSSAR